MRVNSIFLIMFLAFFAVFIHLGCSTTKYFSAENQAHLPNTDPFIIQIFEKYISEADGHRCSMYPTCSEYSKQAINKHGSIIGWIMTCDRLMRCGRDELNMKDPVFINNRPYCFDSLSDNDFWWGERKASPCKILVDLKVKK